MTDRSDPKITIPKCFSQLSGILTASVPVAQFALATLATLSMLTTLIVPSAALAQLDPGQQQALAVAGNALRSLRTNLGLAQQSAGAGTAQPTGSKAKLAGIRLGSAKADVPKVEAALAGLPASDPAVAALQNEFTTLRGEIAALEARLAGTGQAAAPAVVAPTAPAAAPAAVAPTAPVAAPAVVAPTVPVAAPAVVAPTAPAAAPPVAPKLDYRQEETLGNAKFHIREVEGNAAALSALVAKLRSVADESAIPYREVHSAVNTIENARRKAGNAHTGLDQLPAGGAGVAETAARLAAAEKSVAESETFITPLHKKLSALIDPASYPSLKADSDRVGELAGMYGNTDILQNDRPRAAAVLREADAARAEVDRIAKLYAPLIGQQTAEGKRVGGNVNFFAERLASFRAAAEQQKQSLPAQLESSLAEVDKMAAQAVAEKRPLYFTGGIPQRLDWVLDELALLEVLDPPSAATFQTKLVATRKKLAEQQASLRDLIIAQNELPPDRYSGPDKAMLGEKATAAWREQEPGAEVLAIRFPSEAWKREKIWRNQTGDWYFIDRSKLQAQLLVKHDDQLAVIRPVNIWKDHTKGDTIKYFPMDEAGDELLPGDFMMIDKIK